MNINKKIMSVGARQKLEIFQEVVDGFSTHVDWTFETKCGELIDIKLIKDEGEE